MNKLIEANQMLSAAVLAGGMSTRMGVDKALLSLRPADPPMAQLVINRLQTVSQDVFLIASSRPAYESFGVRVVQDKFPGGAALGGIATALANCQSDHCLVVACDMPFLNTELVAWMADQPRDYDVLIPLLSGESRQGGKTIYQTLHAIYSKRCLTPIEEQLASGNRQVIGFFEHVIVRPIPDDQVRSIDPELRSFFNANTPEAAEQARRWLNSAKTGSQ
jgi:molybdopterin-guanine dinucleotide biosynthesis protein A